MSRDSNGNYTSPSSGFVTNTTISSSVMNGKLDDIGTEITDSLSRSGKGGMTARMRGVDGTAALPAYAFTSETTLGLYRAGAADLRVADNATDVQKWSGTGTTLYQAATAQKGLTVTNSTSNAVGTTSTGNGTGAGGAFTGGATGPGLTAAAGGGNANGGTLTGSGTGSGVRGTGGATGVGGTFQGGATSGAGLMATGGPSSTGVNAQGGSGNAAGLAATGSGTGVGGQFSAGTAATGADPTNAVELTNGNLKLSGTAPNKDEATQNVLSPSNLCQAHGMVTVTSGSIAATDGRNIASVGKTTFGGSYDVLRVTFAQAFASANYTCVPTAQSNATPLFFTASVVNKATTHVDIMLIRLNVSPPAYVDIDDAATNAVIEFTCHGAQ